MLGLGLNIAKPYMIHELDMLTIPDLLMWYERGAAVLFRQAFVQEWPNHPELNSAYDLVGPTTRKLYLPRRSITSWTRTLTFNKDWSY